LPAGLPRGQLAGMTADAPAPSAPLPAAVLDRLREALGPEGVVTGDDGLLPYRSDEFPTEPGTPLAALRPSTREELAAAVSILAEAGVPFVPRGAGSGLAGGAVPREAVVVSTERMARILEVDPEARRAVVEPGVVTADISEAARPHGLRYLPDPASHEFSSIGGNVATAAGGPHCLRHGVTEDHVTRIEVVLPDGEPVTLGRGTDGGLDLAGLFVGSEGTLGVVARVEVRLVPRPPAVRTALALFDSLEDAGRAVSEILERVVPVALELMDGPALEAVERSPHAAGLPTDVAAALIVETEGFEEEAEADLMTAGEALVAAGARDVLAAADEGRRQRLWKARREAYHALEPLAPDLLVQDMTVPRSSLPEVLPRVREIADRHGLRVVNFFHAGDGNLHPNLLFDGSDPEEVERVHRATAEIAGLCVDAGGTITGEHGVGLDKRNLMGLVFGPDELGAQRTVKRAFDPAGICNPGKVLPDDGEDAPRGGRGAPEGGAGGGA
jgi:glycolate oxidase subunit GlcD